MTPSDNQLFPILEVTPEGILNKNGDFTVVFEWVRKSLFSLSPDQREMGHQAITKAIGVFPPGTALHFQDRYEHRQWTADPAAGTDILQQASDEHFRGIYPTNTCLVFITMRADKGRRANYGNSALLKGSITPGFVKDPKPIHDFIELTKQFEAIWETGGLGELEPVTIEQLTGNGERKGIIEESVSLTGVDNLSLSDIHFQQGMSIGGKPCALFTLSDAERLPAHCSPFVRYENYSTAGTTFPIGFLTELGPMLPFDHIVHTFIILDDSRKRLAEMEKQSRRMKSLSAHSRENRATSEALEQFLQEAATGQRKPVRLHCHILIMGRQGEDIGELKRITSADITRLGAVPYQEIVGAPQLWYATIPGNAGELPLEETFDTFLEQAACFLVPETYDRGTSGSFGIRLGDRLTGFPLLVDISDEPMDEHWISNRNKFVLGPSGSGKSVFVNHYSYYYLRSGAHILIIDIGGSYRRLCELFGGVYLAYSKESPICFNPFRLDDCTMPDTEQMESHKALLLSVWKSSGESFRRSEYVALSNALQGYFEYLLENPTVEGCFDRFYEYVKDSYADRLAREKVKATDFDMDNFLYVLRPFYKGGEYDYLLNAMDQPDLLQERLIVFDLDTIRDHPILFPVVTIIIMEIFIRKMRRLEGIRKVLIIEEAWKAIAKEGMAEYLKYVFKTVRKFFGEAIVVTQDIEDILSSPIVKNAILNNADTKILLDMSKFVHRFDEIMQPLGLKDHDKALVLSINKNNDPKRKYKEVFIGYANGPSQVYRTEISLEEYLVYTTEESEKVKVNQYATRHGGLREGIVALARDIRSGAIKGLIVLVLCGLGVLIPQGRASAQALDIIGLAEAVAKKVIEAADLKIQELQNATIVLQNSEKVLENNMTGGLLDDITGWVQQQENLYGEYYQELWQVKSALSTYSKTATLIQRQVQLVNEEQQDWAAVQRDPHFSVAELSHIANVYSGILNESSQNIQQIEKVITAFVTQTDDASRLRLVDETSASIDGNYRDLRAFTQENSLLSLQRAKDEADLLTIKSLYNIP
jgi:conjugation system TraG family ATPase